VSGFLNWPVSGGASFGTIGTLTTKYLKLEANYSSDPSSNLGTAYAISYPFAANFTYTIKVAAAQGTGPTGTVSTYFPTVSVGILPQLLNPGTTDPSDCNDVKESHWDPLAGYIRGSFGENQTATYTIPSFVAPSGYNYIFLLAQSYSGDVVSLISSISITKSANLPLSPSTLSVACGSTTAQTFTVGNPNGITGIQSYTWSLGANNGWLYNGSAAPATITTTAATLSLTPVCGSAQSNVSVSATIGGTVYAANNICTVTNGAGSLTINGSSVICSASGVYSVSGVPCGQNATWSVSPAGYATLSCTNCNQTTVTPQVQNMPFTLSATATGCSGQNLNSSLTVSAGNTLTGTIYQAGLAIATMNTANSVPAGATSVYFQWSGVSNITCTQSSTSPPVSQTGFIYYPSPGYFWFTLSSGQSITVNFTGTGCGGAVLASRSFYVGSSHYAVSPNPASGTVTIASISSQTQATELSKAAVSGSSIKMVTILDANGSVKKQQQFSGITKTVQLDVSSLLPGIYFVQISDGQYSETQKLVISR
jgi:hypothetical protein